MSGKKLEHIVFEYENIAEIKRKINSELKYKFERKTSKLVKKKQTIFVSIGK